MAALRAMSLRWRPSCRGHAATSTPRPSHSYARRSAFLSTIDPAAWKAPQTYDAVFALSFFSHTPDHRFGQWLAALSRALNAGGLLIFTTHGETTIARNYLPQGIHIDLGEAGYHWNPNSDQPDLDSREYGTSIVTRRFVEQKMCGLDLVDYRPGYWWQSQDLYILRRHLGTESDD
jgi:hypothetical protein